MLNSESLRLLTLEILKSKCDLKTADEEEIFKTYIEIRTKLKAANKELKSNDAIQFLK